MTAFGHKPTRRSLIRTELRTIHQNCHLPSLNLVDLVPVASVLAGAVGVPVLAVNLALIVIKFGYEKLTEPPQIPDS